VETTEFARFLRLCIGELQEASLAREGKNIWRLGPLFYGGAARLRSHTAKSLSRHCMGALVAPRKGAVVRFHVLLGRRPTVRGMPGKLAGDVAIRISVFSLMCEPGQQMQWIELARVHCRFSAARTAMA